MQKFWGKLTNEFNEKYVYMKVTNLNEFKKMDFPGIPSSTDAFQIFASINFW